VLHMVANSEAEVVIFVNELKLVNFVPCMVETPIQPLQIWEKKLKPVDFVLHTMWEW